MAAKITKNKKGVILLSGGLDSAVTLYYAKKKGYNLEALTFDYGQRHKKEINAARELAFLNKINLQKVKINISWANSALTKKSINVPLGRSLNKKEIPVTYVSGRNIIFLSFAVSFAESIGAKAVFIGAHIQDYSGYPDCRPQFLKGFEKAADLGLKENHIKIIAPLIKKDKKGIVKLGISLGVPFEYTWSCYKGEKYPCGVCDSCRFRESAFRDLGRVDPLLLRNESKSS